MKHTCKKTKSKVGLIALTSTFLSLPTAALAGPVSFDFLISGNFNVPTFQLVNTSSSASQITGFSITIGDTSRNFDFIDAPTTGGVTSYTIVTGDGWGVYDDVIRTDLVELEFTGFDPGDDFAFDADFDIDNRNTGEDYRSVLFPTSIVTVDFSDGSAAGSLSLTLNPLNTAQPDYRFQAQGDISASVPEPAPLALLGLGLAGLGLRRRKSAK